MFKKVVSGMSVIVVTIFFYNLNPLRVEATTQIIQTYEVNSWQEIEQLSIMLSEYKRKFPNSTELEQLTYIKKQIETGQVNNYSFRLASYIPGYNRLNSEEKKLFKENSLNAIHVFNAANFAQNQTKSLYSYNGEDDNFDAFRHATWNAFMKKTIGEREAEKWATAHEFQQKNPARYMDLYNNRIGRQVITSGKTDNQIVNEVKQKVRGGKCWRIVNSKLITTNGDGMRW